MSDVVVRRFGACAWSDEETAGDNPPARLERARAGGYRRKFLIYRPSKAGIQHAG